MTDVHAQSRFLMLLYDRETQSPDAILVDRLDFVPGAVITRLGHDEPVRIELGPDAGDAALTAMFGPSLRLAPKYVSAITTEPELWAELHYDLGSNGSEMSAIHEGLAFRSVVLTGDTASITIGTTDRTITTTVDLAEQLGVFGLPIDLAFRFIDGA